MATITLRSTKGSPLTNTEVDNNFSNINTEVGTKLNSSAYTAADVLAKLVTVDGSGSGLDADLLDGLNSATANTASTIVARDASGNFAAGTITANLTGTASVASSLNYTVQISGGGTGGTTQLQAQTNLGLVIGTNVQAYDAELAALASTTSAANALPYFTGSGTATTTTLTAFGRSLIDDVDQAAARSTLGLVIGTDVQGYDGDLAALASLSGTSGLYVKTAANTAALRTIVGGTGITITNGDGAAGNITIAQTSYVSSVQGNTGAVIVSVPVTSVQGNTGAVIVTNIGGNAGTASNIAWSGVQGAPTALSQFSNNVPFHDSSNQENLFVWNGGTTSTGNCRPFAAVYDGAGVVSNCGNTSGTAITLQDQGTNVRLAYGRYNYNCNCQCNC
jgi:hypothetical protein